MINDRFKSKCFTKENIALQTLELHRAAMNKGNEKIAAEYWKILLKLLGLTRDGPIIANMMPDVIKIIERGGRPLEEGIQFTKIDSTETTGEEINNE